MHIEIQVALNFVISYLYNKLPRRRVNIFGEELEKALKDKFQGHWYPEKPFKGSAFRCIKTGDPVDAVLERAARESGVSIHDILENLPNELSVWVDPGEVSYRIGEKSQIKILYSENSDNHDENNSADREVNKTFNPEAACFRPIDAINTSLNSLSLSPKNSPLSGSSPHSACSSSPTFKNSPNGVSVGGSFMSRNQPPLTFTTATFAQTKFGSTKLKTSSKRSNSSYRMSPTEFSNYIKQRAIQQQQQQQQQQQHQQYIQQNSASNTQTPNHFGPIGPISPARSLSPNPLGLNLAQNNSNPDPFFFPNLNGLGYQQLNGHRNVFETHFQQDALFNAGGLNKFNNYLEPNGFYGLRCQPQTQQTQMSNIYPQQPQLQNNLNLKLKIANNIFGNGNASKSPSTINDDLLSSNNVNTSNKQNAITVTLSSADSDQEHQISPIEDASKLHSDGLNSFYTNSPSSYQQLLVAN